MAVRELRICDVCETDYAEDNAAWMVMTAVNAPEEMGVVSYDFCSFACLHDFVTSPEEDEIETDAEAEAGQQAEAERQHQLRQQAGHTETIEQVRAAVDAEMRPAMSLLEAVAMGQKPGFDPVRDGR